MESTASILTPSAAADLLLRRRSARDRLLGFVEYTAPYWTTGRHHRLICEALERIERGETRRLMIFTPPRHSKSELASKAFPAWYLGRHPDRQIIACSYNGDLATDFGRAVRNRITDETFQALFPGVSLAPDSMAANRMHTGQGGVYVAAGIGGAITGRGAHVAIIDDPIRSREDADSERIRQVTWDWYNDVLYTRLMPGGAIVLMMTRWHEDDLAGRLLEQGGWDVLTLPAVSNEYTDNERALWPEWFPLDKLREMRATLPARTWEALYQQSPTTESGAYTRREWFSDRRDQAPPVNVYIACDFAVRQAGEGSDPDSTELGVFGLSGDGDLYVLDWWHGQTDASAWIRELIRLIRQHRPRAVFGEGGVIRRAIEPFLVKQMRAERVHARLEWVNPIHDKATRGRSFQAMASMGRVYFPRAPWADRIIEQCVRFPGAREDDAFDVLSLMCLAIDRAHGAIVSTNKAAGRRDRYDSGIIRGGWKVV